MFGLFAGSSISAVDQTLLSDLSTLAAHLQSPDKARSVLEGRDVNGYTLLHHAALNGCVGALKMLLSNEGKRITYELIQKYFTPPAPLIKWHAYRSCVNYKTLASYNIIECY